MQAFTRVLRADLLAFTDFKKLFTYRPITRRALASRDDLKAKTTPEEIYMTKLFSKYGLAAAFASCGLAFVPGSASAAEPDGTWVTGAGKSHVRVSHCGAAICGNVVWLAEPNDENGKPKTDYHNESEAKRSRPMMGVPILLSMAPDGDSYSGKIYNAEDGKTYSAHFKLTDDNHAEVKGCVLGIICKSQTWTRK